MGRWYRGRLGISKTPVSAQDVIYLILVKIIRSFHRIRSLIDPYERWVGSTTFLLLAELLRSFSDVRSSMEDVK